MGTYEQPTVFTPDQLNVTKGLVAGIGQGMTGISKGLATQQANLAKAEKERIAKQKGISKDLRKLTVNFGKGGDYLDETIDLKFDNTVNAALKDLYDNYEYGTEAYNQRVSEIEVMASMATAGMGHMQKYAGIASDYYITPAAGSNEFVAKKASNNGASLNSNDPVYNQMFIDFGKYHGESGNFFTSGDKIGWNFDYYEIENEDGVREIVSKGEMNRRFDADPSLDRSEYKLQSKQLIFNGLSDDIESGAHIIGGVDRDAFMKFGDDQWNEFGKGTYDQFKASGGETFTEEFTEDGELITKEIVSYEKANKAIRDKYIANAQNMTFDQNIWQSLGFDGVYNDTPAEKIRAAGALADVAIKNKAKFDVVNYKNKAQKQNVTDKMINVYQTKRLPGAPEQAVMVVPDQGNPGVGRTVDGYAGIRSFSQSDSSFRTKAGHVFGTREAYEAGYVYDDYVKMAEYFDPSGAQGNLDDLGVLLSTMSPSDGVTYKSGTNTQFELWQEYELEYIRQTGRGQMDADFFNWLAGNDPDGNIPTNPIPNAGNILAEGFYKKNGSYIAAVQATGSTQVLDLLLKESNITTSASNKLVAGYNTSQQSSGGGSSSRSGIGSLKGTGGGGPTGSGGTPTGVSNITTPQLATPVNSNFVMNSGVASYSPGNTVIYDVNNIDKLTGPPDEVPGLNFLIGIEETVGCVDANGNAVPCGGYGQDKAMVDKTIKRINNSYLSDKGDIGKSYPGFKNDKMWGSDWENLPENFKTTILQYGFNTSWDPRVVTLLAAGKISKGDRGKYHRGDAGFDIDKKWNELKGSIDYTKLDQNKLVDEMEDIYKNTYANDGSENYKYNHDDPGKKQDWQGTDDEYKIAKQNFEKYNKELVKVTKPITDKLNKIVDSNAKPLPGKEQEYEELMEQLDIVYDKDTRNLRPTNYPSYKERIELVRKRYK